MVGVCSTSSWLRDPAGRSRLHPDPWGPGERRAEVSPTSTQKGHTSPRLALHWLKQATWVGPTSMKERVYPPVREGHPAGGLGGRPMWVDGSPVPSLCSFSACARGEGSALARSFRCEGQRPPGCPLATAPHPLGHLVSFLKNVLNKMGIFL